MVERHSGHPKLRRFSHGYTSALFAPHYRPDARIKNLDAQPLGKVRKDGSVVHGALLSISAQF
jgi:hypothetical protein